MATTTKPSHNRALTLAGLNALFAEAGIVVQRNDALSLYEASYRGLDYQGKTLLDIGRQLIQAIADESPLRD
jgi:hypothetical protein